MNNWVGVITDAGRELLAQWTAGHTLTVTAVKAGSGTVSEALLTNQTDIQLFKQAMSVIDRYATSEGKLVMKCRLTNESVSAQYTLNQIGVWAKIDSGTAVMVQIFQNTTGVAIPAGSGAATFTYTFHAYTGINNASSVSVTIDTSNVVTQEDMEEYVADELNGYIPKIISPVAGRIPTVGSDGTLAQSAKTLADYYIKTEDDAINASLGSAIAGEWNQLVKDGDFANLLANNWKGVSSTLTATDGTLTITVTSPHRTACRAQQKINIVNGHKYLARCDARKSTGATYDRMWFGFLDSSTTTIGTQNKAVSGSFARLECIVTATGDGVAFLIGMYATQELGTIPSVGDYLDVKNVNLIDLTSLFGEGNEPSTPTEFNKLFIDSFYPSVNGAFVPVWYNVSPASTSFEAQTIITDANPYDKLLIEFKAEGLSSDDERTTVIVTKGTITRVSYFVLTSTGLDIVYRTITVNGTSIDISSGEERDALGTALATLNNTILIPLTVYGIR